MQNVRNELTGLAIDGQGKVSPTMYDQGYI